MVIRILRGAGRAVGRGGLRAGKAIFSRRTATIIRWKTIGPNLTEISNLARPAERLLAKLDAPIRQAWGMRRLRKNIRRLHAAHTGPWKRQGPSLTLQIAKKVRRTGTGKFGGVGAFRGRGRGWRRFLQGKRR